MMCSSLSRITATPIGSHLPPLHRHSSRSPSHKSVSSSPSTSSMSIIRRNGKTHLTPSAATSSDAVTVATERLGVVAKVRDGKPRIVLKFIWMEKNIGFGLDQVVPGYGTIPLSPYYFWPRKDAWEELKRLLEGKPWISQKRMIVLLNQATDIINLWQRSESASM